LKNAALFCSVRRFIVTVNVPSSQILVFLMMEAIVPPKRLPQGSQGVTSQNTAFFKFTDEKTSNLT
jgi:hypothetical protein